MKVLCMGETLLRYSTPKGQRFQDLEFKVHVGGSETNIAVNLSQLGIQSLLLTKLPDHALGDAVMRFLHSYNVDTSPIILSNGRIGSYYLEIGTGNRTSQVIYDRANSCFTTLKEEEVDIPGLFQDVDAFMVSGITVALSTEIKELVIKMMKYCNEHDILVIYDSNYRAKLWSIEAAGQALKEILPYVNVLSAGILDALNLLQYTTDKDTFTDQLNDLYTKIQTNYPQIEYMVSTSREILSSSVNNLTGYIYHNGKLTSSKIYHIDDIVDRVGGGDAFMSGVIYGILHHLDDTDIITFGAVSSVLKHTVAGDANQFNEKEIQQFIESGTSRINR